ncbi:MAG: histidinol-phosphate aminotransferase family protein [Armatimonadetes bacterium]|nr:histidinol-phosphate aminotransferase family protein [Armatimonadota bacterium]
MKPAYHGGQFWDALGSDLSRGARDTSIINADVLDAWFDPPSQLLGEIQQELSFLAKTSPPTYSEGLEQTIAARQGLPAESVLAGPGSSALMYLAWPHLLTNRRPKVALMEPTYGEYDHLSSQVLDAEVVRWILRPEDRFQVDERGWVDWICAERPNIAVLVRPNNPTGTSSDIHSIVDRIPRSTWLWVDEAYIDYTQANSAENLVHAHPNVVVLKSLSKAFALSGMRAAYLVSNPSLNAQVRRFVPPWWVSLPAQVVGSRLWAHLDYYRERWEDTAGLRQRFVHELKSRCAEITASCANWVMIRLPGPEAERICQSMARQGVFIRNAGKSAASLGEHFVRIAVKKPEDQDTILAAWDRACSTVG